MDSKRLAKRHKRQVLRARQKRRLSEPDVRTPEQIAAARLASRPDLRHDSTHSWPLLPSDSGAPETAEGSELSDSSAAGKTEGSE